MYSKILISGRLVEPADDKPRSGVTLTLYSVKNSSVVLKHATYRCVTGGNGEYSFNAAPGTYAVAVSVYGAEPERVGQIRVYSDSLPGDLNTFLMAPAEDDLTPEIIRLVDSMRSEAVKAAESAKQSEQVTSTLASDVATHAEQVASNTVVVEQKTTIATDAAATAVAAKEQASKDALATGKDRQATQTKALEAAASANAAKAAQDSIVEDAADVRDKALQVAENTTLVANNAAAVQLNTEQVAQNTQTVTTKTQQVSENAQAVAANTQAVTQVRDEVVAKTSMAQAAADTATQKAASAAVHDAAAAEYARQAQEAAQATAGALMDGGAADLSAGVYPQPVVVSGTSRPTFWKVTKGGTVGGVDYGVGDTLIYTVAGSGSYYKIDNTESVTSVQGEKGAVTLTPEKIGAEAAGTAASEVRQHAEKIGAHQISGISGLEVALADKYSASNKPNAETLGIGRLWATSDMPDGTLIATSIDASNQVGASFTVDILAKSYSSAISGAGNPPIHILVEGYLWDNTFTSCSGISLGGNFTGTITFLKLPTGKLGIWFPSQGYWKNYGVQVYDTRVAGVKNNLAVMVYNSPRPASTKFVEFQIFNNLTSFNTTVDANGFIKRASPIARLYRDELSAKKDDEYSNSGCVAVNLEASGVTGVREEIGVYRISGSLGFATHGWYIETPADANGNKLLFVEYEQYHNGDILIKTFSPDYSTGRCMAGEPKDIPEGRWIDLRLSMPITEN
ncbi:MAG: prophage tail fiber N-terminal domain-containing protein [Plesiomonas sp.]|nr:prophage tail fiber N-terminal domain-containing protein [Plesiomonas sp.]